MSEEVDYSRFYYRESKPDNSSSSFVEVNDVEIPQKYGGTEVEERVVLKRKRPKRKGKKFLFTFVVLILSFGLIFLCADFFGKGFLTDAIGRAFVGKTYEYYLVAAPASSRYVAYADSLAVKQKGGGGYIVGSDEIWVAYAVYTDRTVATSVSLKNNQTEIYSVKFSAKDDLSERIDSLVKDIVSVIEKWEKGTVTEVEVAALLSTKKDEFGALKQSYSDDKLSLIELLCDGLDSFNISSTEKITGLSQLRYFTCCAVCSAQSVFC